jgi:hypothetical protein
MRPVPSWRVRRRPAARQDAQQRWDRAYQHLLQWTQSPQQAFPREEPTDDHRDVCARFDAAPSPDTNH